MSGRAGRIVLLVIMGLVMLALITKPKIGRAHV